MADKCSFCENKIADRADPQTGECYCSDCYEGMYQCPECSMILDSLEEDGGEEGFMDSWDPDKD